MADEEKTDWTGIAAVRRKRLVDGEVIEGTYEQLVLKLLKVIAADLDALALAEAERMVGQRADELNCPKCGGIIDGSIWLTTQSSVVQLRCKTNFCGWVYGGEAFNDKEILHE